MPLDTNKTTSKPLQKKESITHFMFAPHIGEKTKSLGESIGLFPRIIAMIFSIAGLFPGNHPALMNVPNAKLSLREVMRTSYHNLRFTREGIPQVFLFAAVIITFLFSGLAVLTALLGLTSSHAHAATLGCSAGMFDPCSTTDLSIQWMDYLFSSKQIAYNYGDEVTQSVTIQTALRTALSFYSDAVLVIAGIILMYHLLIMVVETAHTGKPMGRANQVMAPIRLVIAIGLLIPVGSSGLNVSQAILIQVAKWGAGLASHAWATFLTAMETDTILLAAPSAPVVDKVVADILVMKACTKAYNAEATTGFGQTFSVAYTTNEYTNGTTTSYGTAANNTLCGSYIIPSAPSGTTSSVISAVYAGNAAPFNQFLSNSLIDTTAEKVLCFMYPKDSTQLTSIDCTTATPDGIRASFLALVTAFQKAESTYAATLANNSTVQSELANLATTWNKDGWVSAGAWFNSIARLQGDVSDAMISSLPQTTPPDATNMVTQDSQDLPTFYSGATSTTKKTENISQSYDNIIKGLSRFSKYIEGSYKTSTDNQVTTADGLVTTDNSLIPTGNNSLTGSAVNRFLSAVDKNGIQAGVWPANGQSIQTLKTANPLSELSSLGAKFTNMGLQYVIESLEYIFGGKVLSQAGSALAGIGVAILGAVAVGMSGGAALPVMWAAGGLAAAVGGGTVSILGEMMSQYNGVFLVLGALLTASGIFLGFILPMIPFIDFFFAVMTWAIIVFEAVVSMPLFALAHMTPHGDGLAGGMAQRGYFFILSILLRPILTVFGLIAALLLFNISVVFLNKIFLYAASSNVAVIGFATMAKIIYSIMYLVLAYICANTCFRAINHLPNHALSWMGANGPETKDLHDPSKFGSLMGTMVGYMGGQQLASMAQNAAGAVGSSIGQNVLGRAGEVASQYHGKKTSGSMEGDKLKKQGDAAVSILGEGQKDMSPDLQTEMQSLLNAPGSWNQGKEAKAATLAEALVADKGLSHYVQGMNTADKTAVKANIVDELKKENIRRKTGNMPNQIP